MIVQSARALVGCKFRPQGRDPRTGLDCIGLVLTSFAVDAANVRRDYRLRGDHLSELRRALHPLFRRISPRLKRPGDMLLCRVAPEQIHLAIHAGESFIHADARLGKVVETPGTPKWKVAGVYRRRVRPPKAKG